ncbi:hypothetical protein EKE94_17285 [Mesobaculum littorinae]|uniref:Uncharacterized protein n=1 Tax=Mesobaculum littorinae TaxID=2486419 RepID=A0A438AD91_9RHOB|nr:hypothetical protein [Mesobaculum littorinae]RVV96635.1 hypothetical protein EKE94_17285 [Mesobaculum littorinae]
MPKFPFAACVAAALTASALAPPALAESKKCGPRDKVLARLAEKFGETRQSIGLGTKNRVVEVFASDDSGSWTIIVTAPTGTTCLLASGKSFERLEEALPPAGNPA